MTNLEQFIGAFNVRFYAATQVDGMGWTDEEICEFFNAAQLQLVEELAGTGNLEAISDLIKDSAELLLTTGSPAVVVPVPTKDSKKVSVAIDFDDYFYFLSGVAKIDKFGTYDEEEYTSGETDTLGVERISIKDVPAFTASSDNVTYFKRPKIALGGNTSKRLTIVVDNYTSRLEGLTISYICKPRVFNPDKVIEVEANKITNLNEALHNRIVSLAVEIAVRTMVNTQNSNQ